MNDKKTALFRQRLPFHPLLACGIVGILIAHFVARTSWVWLLLMVVLAAIGFFSIAPPTAAWPAHRGDICPRSHPAKPGIRRGGIFPPRAAGDRRRGSDRHRGAASLGCSRRRSASFQLRVTSLRWQDTASHPAVTLQVDWPGPPACPAMKSGPTVLIREI